MSASLNWQGVTTATVGVALIAISACGGDSRSPVTPESTSARLVLQVNPSLMGVGETGMALAHLTSGGDVSGSARWSSLSPSIATVSPAGVVTAITAGDTAIVGAYGTLSANYPIRVIGPSDLDAFTFVFAFEAASGHLTIHVGQTVTLTPRFIHNTSPIASTVFDISPASRLSWFSSDANVVSIQPDGVVKAMSPGVADVSATFLGKVAMVRITVPSS